MKQSGIATPKRAENKTLLWRLARILCVVLGCITLGIILLYFFQEKLIFIPQPISQERAQYIKNMPGIEEINLQMKDGTGLSGWIVKNSQPETTNLIIYYGGNGDELSYMIDLVKGLEDCSIALVNYRGYGLSEGSPSEKGLCSDALEIYDYLSHREDLVNSRIIVMGRSLGTGVATYVAYERNPAAVILVSPYDSLESVARERFPGLPVNILLKHRFDSLSRAPSIKKPLFMLIAADDITIRPWHSKELAEKWGGDVTIQELKGADHNSICVREELWEHVSRFLISQMCDSMEL